MGRGSPPAPPCVILLVDPGRAGRPSAAGGAVRSPEPRPPGPPVRLTLQGFDVGEVLEASGGSFVTDELAAPDERQVAGSAGGRFPARPRLVPCHAADGAHRVNVYRFDAHLDDACGLDDLFGPEVRGRKPERGERLQQPRGVFDCGLQEDIDIAGVARRAMVRQGLGADDQELNVVRGQRPEELVEVWRQFHHAASAGTRRPLAVPPAAGSANTRAQSRLWRVPLRS